MLFLLAFVPFTYSFFYVKSYWNPYDYLDKIPIALVNEDEGSMGALIVQQLLANGTIKFDVVSLEDAKDGIKNKDYYAYFHIPANFTACVSSASTTSKNKGVIIYVPNHKANYLAGQIINRIADLIETTIRGTVAQQVTDRVTSSIQAITAGSPSQLQSMLDVTTQLASGSTTLSSGLSTLVETLSTLSTSSDSFTTSFSSYVSTINEIADNFTAFYKQVSAIATSTQNENLQQYVTQLAPLNAILSEANATNPTTIRSSGDTLDTSAKSLQTATSTMSSSASAANSTSATITAMLTAINTTLTQANTSVPQLVSYVLPGLETYAQEPVALSEEPEGEIKEYGKAFAPMFVSLAFWVVALLSYIFIYFDEDHAFGVLDQDQQGLKQNGYYLIIAAAEAIFTAAMFHLCAWIHLANVPLYYFTCLLTGVTAMAIVQMYMRIFGDIGKFFTVVTIILQLCACGGTFPFETMHAFFRWMHHVLPMTYSIQLFREAMVEVTSKLVGPPIGYLFVFLIVNLVISTCYDLFINWKHRKDAEREDNVEKAQHDQ